MINKIVIKGERCSGTNYLQNLIDVNFNIKSENLLDWKHSYLNTHNMNIHNEDMLVLIIFRNVYDWLLSLHANPHHFYKKNNSFHDFLRCDFNQIFDCEVGHVCSHHSLHGYYQGKEIFYERHPFTLERPRNVLELRNWKNENFLNHSKILKNVYFIKYEDLYNNTERVLTDINIKFLKSDFKFKQYNLYKDTNLPFEKKSYNKISDNDLEFIIENLDWSLENKIGWTIEDIIKIHNSKD